MMSEKQKARFRRPGARQATSEATLKALDAGKFGRTSRLESIVGAELSALGFAAEPQHCVRGEGGRYVACVDFFLPAMHAVLEVNGTFWHADPRFYDRDKPETLRESQRRTLARYAKKEAAISAIGLRLVEVWEHDLLRDSRRAVAEALGVSHG